MTSSPMNISAVKLMVVALVLASLSVICYIVSFLGHTWWIIDGENGNKTIHGLWGRCEENINSTECFDRTDVLKFNEKKGEYCFFIV